VTPARVDAERKVQRYTLLERLLFTLLALISAGGIIVGAVAIIRQNAIAEATERSTCIARITADFQAAVGDALGAPPAPNTERLIAVERIKRTSARLHHIDKVCP
jgi:hypothetical protein